MVKNSEFLSGFSKAMYSNFTPEQFEDFWSELVKENKLESHPWVAKTYETKLLWATAYLRNKFFGRIRTTSQCEAVNSIIKSYVRKKGCIYEFMHNFEHALRGYRNNELVADFKSMFTHPVLSTHLRSIESNAANRYTAEVFKEVKEQIMKVAALIVKSRTVTGDVSTYILTKFCQTDFVREVVYDVSDISLQCSCRLFESRGLPCSHIFYVMKEEHIDLIPARLVLSRWNKEAKVGVLNMGDNGDADDNLRNQARFSAYCSFFTVFCKEVSTKNGVYGEVMDDLMKLHQKYCPSEDPIVGTQKSCVGDPVTVKSKGAPKKNRNAPKRIYQCKNCKSTSHDARNCTKNPNAKQNQNATAKQNVDSVSITDCLSQIQKNSKRKPSCNVSSSREKRASHQPESQNVGDRKTGCFA